MTVEEIKSKISSLEKGIANPQINEAMKEGMKKGVEKLKAELEKLEGKAEAKVEEAEKKVEEAETKAEKKEAQAELKEAKEEVKEVEKVAEKIEKVEDKVEKVHGGARQGAGRKKIHRMERPKGAWGGKRVGSGRKATSAKKMVKPEGVAVEKVSMRKRKAKKKLTVREKLRGVPAKVAKAGKPSKMKTARAFGQTVEYKNDADFCRQLIKAFKKRKAVSKAGGKRKKTKPVFGVITTSVKNAVSKALHNVPTKQIESNPKQFLAKAQRLERSAIKFLEDFKAILGSDYKKSEITSEFGELEKSIKQFVAKFTKK